jgi:hypothetical protein
MSVSLTPQQTDELCRLKRLGPNDPRLITALIEQMMLTQNAVSSGGGGGGGGLVQIDQSTPGNTNGVQLVGTQQTTAPGSATSNGAIVAGATQVTFLAGPGTTVTVRGMPIVPGASITLTAAPGRTLDAVAFTVSGGTLYWITTT